MLTSNLPLCPILAPKPNTILISVDTGLLMQLYNPNTQVLPPGLDLGVCFPLKLAMRLRSNIPVSRAQAPRIWTLLGRIGEGIMSGEDRGVYGLEEWLVDEPPVSVGR